MAINPAHVRKTYQAMCRRFDKEIRIYYGVTEATKTQIVNSDGSTPLTTNITVNEDNILALYNFTKEVYRTTLAVQHSYIESIRNQSFWISLDKGLTVKPCQLQITRNKVYNSLYWIYLELQ